MPFLLFIDMSFSSAQLCFVGVVVLELVIWVRRIGATFRVLVTRCLLCETTAGAAGIYC